MTEALQFTPKEKRRRGAKIYQFFRFIILNIKILKAVDHSKRS